MEVNHSLRATAKVSMFRLVQWLARRLPRVVDPSGSQSKDDTDQPPQLGCHGHPSFEAASGVCSWALAGSELDIEWPSG